MDMNPKNNIHLNKNKRISITNILSNTDIIASVGSIDGISIGDRFKIVDNEKNSILDPLTGETLGKVSRYKYEVIVTDIFPKYSQMTTVSTTSYERMARNVYINTSLSSSRHKEKMNVRESDIDNIFNEYSHSIVKVGDRLEQSK